MSHWTDKFIGKSFKPVSSGPDSYDCYSLSQAIILDQCGISMPNQDALQSSTSVAVNKAWNKEQKREGWRKLDKPEKFSTVFMAGRNGLFSHVGTIIDDDCKKNSSCRS